MKQILEKLDKRTEKLQAVDAEQITNRAVIPKQMALALVILIAAITAGINYFLKFSLK